MSDLKFRKEEFAKRLANVKAAMAKRGFDVLVLAEPSNIYYLTGYNFWSFYTPQALVVALDADLPIWFGRMMDGPSARRITYLAEDSIQPYPDSYVPADRPPSLSSCWRSSSSSAAGAPRRSRSKATPTTTRPAPTRC